ncbi:hypothetical protein AABB24_035964, partial [Solanum stoloniferum]
FIYCFYILLHIFHSNNGSFIAFFFFVFLTQNRRLSVSSAMAKRKAMAANSSGLENNQAGKLNTGAAKKRPALSNISNHTNVSARNSISHSSKLVPCTSKIVSIKKMCSTLTCQSNSRQERYTCGLEIRG